MTEEIPQRLFEGHDRGVVMLVEDNELESAALSDALEALGFSVVVCEDGAVALEKLRAGVMPSLILLDLHTPRMSGWEFRLAQRDHQGWRRIPVIAMSGDRSAQAAAIDADRYLAKPFQRAMLREAIDQVLADVPVERAQTTKVRAKSKSAGMVVQRSLEVLGDSLTLARTLVESLQRKLPHAEGVSVAGVVRLLSRAQQAAMNMQAVLHRGQVVDVLAADVTRKQGGENFH